MATDQLNFFIFETDTAVQQKLRRFVTGYSVRADVDVRMDWAVKPEQLQFVTQLVGDAHIALLNADIVPHCIAAGEAILRANPQCLILFYGGRSCDLAAYFSARPVAYLDDPEKPEVWERALQKLHKQIREDSRFFSWTSKFCRYYIPCTQIITIRSNRGSLEIHTQGVF